MLTKAPWVNILNSICNNKCYFLNKLFIISFITFYFKRNWQWSWQWRKYYYFDKLHVHVLLFFFVFWVGGEGRIALFYFEQTLFFGNEKVPKKEKTILSYKLLQQVTNHFLSVRSFVAQRETYKIFNQYFPEKYKKKQFRKPTCIFKLLSLLYFTASSKSLDTCTLSRLELECNWQRLKAVPLWDPPCFGNAEIPDWWSDVSIFLQTVLFFSNVVTLTQFWDISESCL